MQGISLHVSHTILYIKNHTIIFIPYRSVQSQIFKLKKCTFLRKQQNFYNSCRMIFVKYDEYQKNIFP